MGKEISYSMGKGILELASQPLRSRQDAILLLLYTIRMFEVDELSPENTDIKVVISINKMNRIFYVLEDKIFSIQFPFNIEIQENKIVRIYDVKTGVDVDSMLISTLIRIYEKKKMLFRLIVFLRKLCMEKMIYRILEKGNYGKL